MRSLTFLLFLPMGLACLELRAAEPLVVTGRMHHLRAAAEREWANFPEIPEAKELNLAFTAANSGPATLRLRQQDVKQRWKVRLNAKELGELPIDENDMVVYFEILAGTLVEGENRLLIEQQGDKADDVRVGEIHIEPRAMAEVLGETTVQVSVTDAARAAVPCRITVLNEAGALQTLGAASNEHMAVRPGIAYTASGRATFGLPAGSYTVIAGRGFEYSIDRAEFTTKPGETSQLALAIRREVPTPGYVACDTHVHTRTYSGHGDATIEERMITLAAEGIELPIATDHNVHIDYESPARAMKVREYFTPVIGNEVTTRTGHFNVFPIASGAAAPDHRSDDWNETFAAIFATPGVKIAILNHARDLHGGTRPFGPLLFNETIGENTAGWPMKFNAMEVVNSGATQTDPLELLRDWMALLNRGYAVTPVGSSDSHDVGRHFVGQGRTYIRVEDGDPGRIDVEQAVESFLAGRVMVSYGLLAELEVNGRRSGEIAEAAGDEVQLKLRVLGPHWVSAERILLFANGELVREEAIEKADRRSQPAGVLWADTWRLPKPPADVHFVAVAVGPGIASLHWPTAKPYQPVSNDPSTIVLGSSGAVWFDANGDGAATPARTYAEQVFASAKGDVPALLAELAGYDQAVAAQAASLLQASGRSLLEEPIQRELAKAEEPTRQGFKRYLDAWRAGQLAREGG